jgi:hypothetical protein
VVIPVIGFGAFDDVCQSGFDFALAYGNKLRGEINHPAAVQGFLLFDHDKGKRQGLSALLCHDPAIESGLAVVAIILLVELLLSVVYVVLLVVVVVVLVQVPMITFPKVVQGE